ncbi:MAG: WecB/TagA/CpsF family glycosyltransferase [Candidatus Peregrinibacteria bacterium]
MSSSRVLLLGVPLDPVTLSEAVDCIVGYLKGSAQQHVMTPNAEMLVEAHRSPAFNALLQKTALNIPDSVGLLKMARWTGQMLPERVTGVDTVIALCALLDSSVPVFLLGAAPGIAEAAAKTLQNSNPRLAIVGCFAGSPKDEESSLIIQRINAASPHLLLVAYGAPAQDFWIEKHLQHLPSVRVAMGIGGTFDFLAGKVTRAPAVLRKFGLEWLWRLIREPKRFKRIWNAVVVFPILVMRHGKGSLS